MKKTFLLSIICALLLSVPWVGYTGSIEVHGNPDIKTDEEITTAGSPGDIIDISCSESYPTLGKPVDLIFTFNGTILGTPFEETLNITDSYTGFVVPSTGIEWTSGISVLDKVTVRIGRAPTVTKKVRWYPVIVGNHTLHAQAGSFPVKTKNISVGFDTQTIIFPSLGCPSIIKKDTMSELSIVVSEERIASDQPLHIQEVQLQRIDGSAIYNLTDQTTIFSTWIQTGEEVLEDDCVVRYNVSLIPSGLYDLTIRTQKNTFSWPHAVRIIDENPAEFTFVQLTDIHIGKSTNMINEKNILMEKIRFINEELHPDFVVLSGDSVDWYNEQTHSTSYQDLQEALKTCSVPVFTVPGNHERYGHRLLGLYAPFINLTAYHRFLNPLEDYAFEYGGINFVLLDSGYDYSRWDPTSEGSGLTNTQIDLLQQRLGNDDKHQIIVMHHCAVNDKNDSGLQKVKNDFSGGNDECIAFNRPAFITYCHLHNVSIVLSGHSHENHVYTSLGVESESPTDWPLFIQTDTATLKRIKSGGRVVTINDGDVMSYDYVPFI